MQPHTKSPAERGRPARAIRFTVVLPPASRHPGGANLLLADGSVDFISETIDTGDLTVQQPDMGESRYGVWGAMGSKSGGETK